MRSAKRPDYAALGMAWAISLEGAAVGGEAAGWAELLAWLRAIAAQRRSRIPDRGSVELTSFTAGELLAEVTVLAGQMLRGATSSTRGPS